MTSALMPDRQDVGGGVSNTIRTIGDLANAQHQGGICPLGVAEGCSADPVDYTLSALVDVRGREVRAQSGTPPPSRGGKRPFYATGGNADSWFL